MNAILASLAVLAAVNLDECPKCDKRIKISDDGTTATVNLARLKDDSPDAAALVRRTDAMKARAERLLARGKAVANGDVKCPLMGWSSWNTFGVDISEEIILGIAQAMATNGLKAAGYLYVNIDDGFFWGHDASGRLQFHPQRFPRGMKGTVDGIHAVGLRAGIYSDAGADTCGSMWGGSGSGGKDKGGVGGGLYGHDASDCALHFNELGFDFIKVDYCGGQRLKLDEKARYAEIARAIRATGRTDVRFNMCRWAFPGTWAAEVGDSWRTTKDIRANWKSICDLVGENLYLSAYASPGHYNDMDMLEVGQLKGLLKTVFGAKHGDNGITSEEETTHFGMWRMLSSPLLIGCDVRTMPESSYRLITNPYMIAMNQNAGLGVQGYVVRRDGETYVLVKDAETRFGTARYVALYTAEDAERVFAVKASDLDLGGRIDAFDLVARADVGSFEGEVTVKVPAHGSRFYLFDAERRLERTVYEAETAFLTDYQELRDAVKAGTAFPQQAKGASGGVDVRYLGNRESNDLVWKDVKVLAGGRRTLAFTYSAPEDRSFFVQVDGGAKLEVKAPKGVFATVTADVELSAGVHRIRLSNPTAWAPDIDVMRILPPQAPIREVRMPSSCTTPDGMCVDPKGRLVVAAPNNARTQPGAIFRVDAPGAEPVKWFEVPAHPETGYSQPMGVCFGPAGELYVCDCNAKGKARLLVFTFKDDKVASCETVATGLDNTNGVKFWQGRLYVTVAFLYGVRRADGAATSGLYRFAATDRNVRVGNTPADPQCVFSDVTRNPDVTCGLNGVAIDSKGRLYVGNYGDGRVWRMQIAVDGTLGAAVEVVRPTDGVKTPDGLCVDSKDNLYIADMRGCAAVRVSPAGEVSFVRLGGFVRPSEPCVWQDRLYVANYGATTLAELPL